MMIIHVDTSVFRLIIEWIHMGQTVLQLLLVQERLSASPTTAAVLANICHVSVSCTVCYVCSRDFTCEQFGSAKTNSALFTEVHSEQRTKLIFA